MLKAHLHVLHPSIEVTDMPDFLSFAFEILLPQFLFALGWLRFNSCSQDWQFHDLLEEHVPICIDLYFKIMKHFFLCGKLFRSDNLGSLTLVVFFLLPLLWDVNFLGNQEVCMLRLLRMPLRHQLCLRVLIGDLIVDDFDGSLEDKCYFQNTGVMLVYLIQL